VLRPVRGLDHPLTHRGAYKLYAGSAERDARLRFLGSNELAPDGHAFARISISRPLVLDFKDAFVLREAGRQETVAAGDVLDIAPPARPGPDTPARLQARLDADRATLARLLVTERGTVRASDVLVLTGGKPDEALRRGALRLEGWLVAPEVMASAGEGLVAGLAHHHSEHPLQPGLEIEDARAILAVNHAGFADPGLADAAIAHLGGQGQVVREG